jgi:hypothetical protein
LAGGNGEGAGAFGATLGRIGAKAVLTVAGCMSYKDHGRLDVQARPRDLMHNNKIISTKVSQDEVRISLHWEPPTEDGLVRFYVEKGDRGSVIDFTIDLYRVPKFELQCIISFWERYDKTTAEERASAAAWLIELWLKQQRPNSTQEECEAELRRLLLCEDTPHKEENTGVEQSIESAEAPLTLKQAKQALFEALERDYVQLSGLGRFFEESKTLPYFSDIQSSCRELQGKCSFWTPKVPVNSAVEQAQAEQFFIKLRHLDPVATQNKYGALIRAHLDDQKWRDAIGQTIQQGLRDNNTAADLGFQLLGLWLPTGLWGMRNYDRSVALEDIYGLRASEGTLRTHIRGLGLLDWANFPQFYAEPPFGIKLYTSEEKEKTCRLYWQDWVYTKLGLPIPPPPES